MVDDGIEIRTMPISRVSEPAVVARTEEEDHKTSNQADGHCAKIRLVNQSSRCRWAGQGYVDNKGKIKVTNRRNIIRGKEGGMEGAVVILHLGPIVRDLDLIKKLFHGRITIWREGG